MSRRTWRQALWHLVALLLDPLLALAEQRIEQSCEIRQQP